MLTSISKQKYEIGLVDLPQLRHTWKQWAGPKTEAWLNLSDADLSQRLESVTQIKRFLEKYCVDPAFRADLSTDPCLAITQHSIKVELEDVRTLWDQSWDASIAENQPVSEAMQHFLSFSQEWMLWTELLQIGDRTSHPQFKAWRERQIVRSQFQLPEGLSQNLAHIPVCFELSQGCSVGCYFCAVSAPKLEDIFIYNAENSKLWRGILELLRETLGESVSASCCYWATDPLDNPDYEEFMLDFHGILGVFPQTTTAQPTKDLDRVRSLLKLSFEKGCKLNRFSILSTKILDQVYAAFTAEDLAFTGLVPQNPGAQVLTRFPFESAPARKWKAGRLLERANSAADSQFMEGTIACATGFLINLVERSIKLISPCQANSDYPLGYITFDQGTFSDLNSFRTLLNQLIEQNMPLSVSPQQSIQFRPNLQYTPLFDGFKLSTDFRAIAMQRLLPIPGTLNYAQLGRMIREGSHSTAEISNFFSQQGVPASETLGSLNHLLQQGVLQEPND